MPGERSLAKELGFALGGVADLKHAAGESWIFLQLNVFVIGLGARGIEQEQTKSVAGPAIVTEIAFEPGLLDARLLVNGGDGAGGGFGGVAQAGVIGLGAADDGIDERGGGRTKVEGRDGAAIGRLQQGLIFSGGEEELVGAVAIIVERFDARREAARSLLVGEKLGADEAAPKLGAQMRSVKTAEDSVPVGIIALRAEKQVAGFLQLFAGFGNAAARGRSVNAMSDVQHFFVEQIGFGIFAEETAPGAAAQEREHFGARSEFLEHLVIALANARGQRPFHHFGVGGGRQVGAARGSVRGEVFAGGGGLQPGGIFLEGHEEFLEPGVLIAMVEGAGPDAEFLHIVAHGGHLAGVGAGSVAKIGDDLLDGAEGNEIAEKLLAGENANGLAMVFGDVVGEQFFGLEAGGEKMDVVENGVADVGFGEDRGELRFPHALGEPSAGGALAEVLLEIVGETDDLDALIGRRNGNENGLVEAAANHLDLATLDEQLEAHEIFGAMLFDPGQQRAGIMKAGVDGGMLLERFEERKIAAEIGLLKNVVKIAARLMGMNEQHEVELGRQGDEFFSKA